MLANAAHPPAAVVGESLRNLGWGVHYEWPLSYNGLIDRLAVEEQDRTVFERGDFK